MSSDPPESGMDHMRAESSLRITVIFNDKPCENHTAVTSHQSKRPLIGFAFLTLARACLEDFRTMALSTEKQMILAFSSVELWKTWKIIVDSWKKTNVYSCANICNCVFLYLKQWMFFWEDLNVSCGSRSHVWNGRGLSSCAVAPAVMMKPTDFSPLLKEAVLPLNNWNQQKSSVSVKR